MIRYILCLMLSAGMAVACESTGLRLASENKDAPDAYVVLDDFSLAQPFSLHIAVCGENIARELRADAVMPAHKHGMNYIPEVTPLDGNRFKVDGMLFHMPGVWELRFDVIFNAETVFYTSSIDMK